MPRFSSLLLILTVLPLVSCSPRVVHVPVLRPQGQEPKSLPQKDRIPPTQRPYEIDGHAYYPLPNAYGYREIGVASWYGRDFHGRKTSNGETYDMYAETAAHKTLPMGTHVLVRNLENHRQTIVRINDRGPFVRGRIIDLSLTAAKKLGIDQCGTARVEVVALGEAATYRSDGRTYQRFLPYADPNRGEFFVQVGSFTNKRNALRLRDRLLAMNRKTAVQVYNAERATYYRVQVRAGQTLGAARQVEKVMEEMGFPEAFVVAR